MSVVDGERTNPPALPPSSPYLGLMFYSWCRFKSINPLPPPPCVSSPFGKNRLGLRGCEARTFVRMCGGSSSRYYREEGRGKEDEGETGEREAPRGLDGEEWGNEKKRDTFTIAFNICHYGLNIPQCSSL